MNGLRRHNWALDSLASVRPLVILFIRPDCGHSVKLAETLDEFAKDYQGRLDFLTIDITQDGELGRSFQVHWTPALLILRNGQVLYQALGLLPERELASMFDSALRSQARAALRHSYPNT